MEKKKLEFFLKDKESNNRWNGRRKNTDTPKPTVAQILKVLLLG